MSARMVDRSELVEVPMTEPHDYSPAHVRRYLRRYHELAVSADGLRGIRYDGDRILHSGTPDRHRLVHVKRDLDEAIGWLQTMDAQAAAFVFEHYIGFADNLEARYADRIADRYGVSRALVYKVISSAITEMSAHLGYRAPVEEAEESAA